MKDAVEQGYKLATQGDIVLLSPACSSFDWYSCFEERGDDFKTVFICCKKGDTINETYHYFRWWHWWTYIPSNNYI